MAVIMVRGMGPQTFKLGLAGFGAQSGIGLCRIFGPRMPWVLRAHVFTHIRIAAGPKAWNVLGDLNGAVRGGQKSDL